MDGIINVHKEKGFTSHDVVAKLRGILHQKKIGHTGTLDPDATGVLPVCVGKATKVCELLTDQSKTYTAVVRLGVVTDTQDMTGNLLKENEVSCSREEVEEAVSAFTGEIWQTPPMYSALKVNGKRLYELARQGIEVERKRRKIMIYSSNITDYHPEKNEFTLTVTCSKGTYIRTLCHDIGEKLSCGATMAVLARTGVGEFKLEDSYTLAQIEDICKGGKCEDILIPVDAIFQRCPEVVVHDDGVRHLKNGNVVSAGTCRVPQGLKNGEMVRMYDSTHRFYALYKFNDVDQCFTNHKMFFNYA